MSSEETEIRMGIIQRAKDDQFAKLQEDSEAAERHRQEEAALELRRIEVITKQLTVVATTLQEPLEQISRPTGLPQYYVLGDVVIMVQLFMIGGDKPDPAVPRLVTMQYCAFLMAIDGDGRLVQRKVGTLKWLDYSGIAKVITQAPPDFIFDADEVKQHIPQLNR